MSVILLADFVEKEDGSIEIMHHVIGNDNSSTEKEKLWANTLKNALIHYIEYINSQSAIGKEELEKQSEQEE